MMAIFLLLQINSAFAQETISTPIDSIRILNNKLPRFVFSHSYNSYDSLFAEKLYDAVIDSCKTGIVNLNETNDGSTYYQYLAYAYAFKSRMDSARSIAIDYVHKKSRGDFDMYDVMLFFDYTLCYPLASDSLFWNKSMDILSHDYSLKGYPLSEYGLQLLLLASRQQRDGNYYNYLKANATNESGLAYAASFKQSSDSNIAAAFIRLYEKHPAYFSSTEIGYPCHYQTNLIQCVTDINFHENIFLPILKTALDNEMMLAYNYVEELVNIEKLKDNGRQPDSYYKLMEDSLCQTYHCYDTVITTDDSSRILIRK